MTTNQFNSQIRPENFSHHFDAHIYFAPEQLKEIEALREYLISVFQNKEVFIGHVINKEVGPHPMPMLELNFSRAIFTDVVLFLMGNRKDFDVLVHPISDDDLYDHTQGAMWLGKSHKLKFKI